MPAAPPPPPLTPVPATPMAEPMIPTSVSTGESDGNNKWESSPNTVVPAVSQPFPIGAPPPLPAAITRTTFFLDLAHLPPTPPNGVPLPLAATAPIGVAASPVPPPAYMTAPGVGPPPMATGQFFQNL